MDASDHDKLIRLEGELLALRASIEERFHHWHERSNQLQVDYGQWEQRVRAVEKSLGASTGAAAAYRLTVTMAVSAVAALASVAAAILAALRR